MNTLKILTFNAGLFEIRWGLSVSVVKDVDYVSQRYARLATVLLNCGADIILLQEVFTQKHRQELVQDLERVYPYASSVASHAGTVHQGHGLMVFSKHRIDDASFTRFKEHSWLELIAIDKGYLSCKIHALNFGTLRVVNTHAIAGYPKPTDPGVCAVRTKQLEQIADTFNDASFPTIIGGDLNCGPKVDDASYSFLGTRGFQDTFSLRTSEQRILHTWDPSNPLTSDNYRECPPQQCDHLMYRPNGRPIKVDDSRIRFTEHVVPVAPQRDMPLSDHYALETTFVID